LTLQVTELTKRYGTRSALEGISFVASRGDIVGLLGRNGAGKTTTIRLLTTLLAPTSGEFWVAGQPGTAEREIRRRIGVLPESSGFPRHQTAREYLRYHARLFGFTSRAAGLIADNLLDEVGLRGPADLQIGSYSRGMRQRLGIARAMVNDPVVLFLDEPTLGLDPEGQTQIIAMIREISRARDTTVLLSTHMLGEVEEICSRIVILEEGRLVVSGSLHQVITAAVTQRFAAMRVPYDRVEEARQVLTGVSGITVEPLSRENMLQIVLPSSSVADPTDSGAGLNRALAAVVQAGVPVLSFRVEGASLSDAFLALTNAKDGS